MKTFGFNNCRIRNMESIYQELYSRIILPFYNLLIVIVSLLLILKSKSDLSFNRYKYSIFIGGFLLMVFIETSTKLLSKNILENYIIFSLPFVFFFFAYSYFLKKLKINS